MPRLTLSVNRVIELILHQRDSTRGMILCSRRYTSTYFPGEFSNLRLT